MFWQMLSLANMSPVVLYLTAEVGGCLFPISLKAMCIAAHFWKLTNKVPISGFIALVWKFRIV